MSEMNRHRRDAGYVVAMSGLLLLPLLAFTGLAVDLGGWYAQAAHIQRATDAASLAGVASLPRGIDAAEQAAFAVAEQNGFIDNGDTIRVVVEQVGPDRVRVEITDRTVPQYFTSMFRDEVSITRASVAEYVPPVRMGSPRNFLGTQRLTNAQRGFAMASNEEYFLSINSRCAMTEDGDLRATQHMGSWGAANYCNPGTPTNPTYNPDGYIYGVRVEEGYTAGPIVIEVFDAALCPTGNTPTAGWHDSPRLAASVFNTIFTIRDPAPNPYTGTIRNQVTVGGATGLDNNSGVCAQATGTNSGGWRNGWRALGTITDPQPGEVYGIQVQSSQNTGSAAEQARRGNLNNFALRARTGATFTACSADPFEPDPLLTTVTAVNCPNLFAMEHMSIFANSAGSTATFYLASIGPEHSNKTLVVDLFDPGEGGSEIRLINPLNQAVPIRRSVQQRFDGEVAPLDGWAPVNESFVNIGGNGPEPGPGRLSAWRFNERQLRLEYELPDIAAVYGGATWWKVEYRFGSGTVTDRTTWSVTVRGDPVRLIE
jgi:hypothetical protein